MLEPISATFTLRFQPHAALPTRCYGHFTFIHLDKWHTTYAWTTRGKRTHRHTHTKKKRCREEGQGQSLALHIDTLNRIDNFLWLSLTTIPFTSGDQPTKYFWWHANTNVLQLKSFYIDWCSMIERLIGPLIRPVIIFSWKRKKKNHIFQYLARYIDWCSRMRGKKKNNFRTKGKQSWNIFL